MSRVAAANSYWVWFQYLWHSKNGTEISRSPLISARNQTVSDSLQMEAAGFS